MTWHASLPYGWVQHAYRSFRRRFFTKERPIGTYYRVEYSPEQLRRVFGRVSAAPNWEFSYNYKGEDINLARVYYDDTQDYDMVWWQFHLRGWEHSDGSVWMRAHYEAEPTEHPEAHLEGTGTTMDEGMQWLQGVLLDAKVPYEKRVWGR